MYKRKQLPLLLELMLSSAVVVQEYTIYSVPDKPVTGTFPIYVNGRYHIENSVFQADSVEVFHKSRDVIAE